MMKGSPNTKGLNIFIHNHSYTGYSDVTTFFKTIKNQLIKTFKLFSKMWVGGIIFIKVALSKIVRLTLIDLFSKQLI